MSAFFCVAAYFAAGVVVNALIRVFRHFLFRDEWNEKIHGECRGEDGALFQFLAVLAWPLVSVFSLAVLLGKCFFILSNRIYLSIVERWGEE